MIAFIEQEHWHIRIHYPSGGKCRDAVTPVPLGAHACDPPPQVLGTSLFVCDGRLYAVDIVRQMEEPDDDGVWHYAGVIIETPENNEN